MKVPCPSGEAAQDRSLDLADVIELAIDQGLAEVRRRLASARWPTGDGICLAHRDAGQVA